MFTRFGLRRLVLAAGVAAGSLLAASSAQAVVFDTWTNITNNGNQNVGGQLAVDVTDAGSNRVSFKFTNNVGIASSITDIYFDDNAPAILLSLFNIVDSGAGVAFSNGANPSNLPGGAPYDFTADFSADSDAPVAQNGVSSASEWVTLTYNLVGGKTFADLLAELNNGGLEIGLHVQSIGTAGGSDGYLLTGSPPPSVPEPAALGLFGVGLIGLGLLRRRRAA